MQIKWVGANPKNFAIGRQNEKITKICLHWIVGKLSAADAVFNNPDRQVSAHFGIGHTEVHQYVREEDTAYHAGNFTVNKQSIGIEHEGGPDLPISEDTHKTSIELVTDICRRYNIPADRQHILKHSEIKATQCPGTLDIDRIVREVQKRLATPSDSPTDTIPVPKKDFEQLVDNSNEHDKVWDYVGVDRKEKSGKIISAFENLKDQLGKCRTTLETLTNNPTEVGTTSNNSNTNSNVQPDNVGEPIRSPISGNNNASGSSSELQDTIPFNFQKIVELFQKIASFLNRLLRGVRV